MNKGTLRKIYLERRSELSDTEVEQLSQSICVNFFQAIDLASTSIVHLFLPIPKFKEPNTHLIIDRIKNENRGIDISIPKIESNGTLKNYYLNGSRLVTNTWGVTEPVDGTLVSDTSIDLVVVPLLAFDEHGNRLGYGKGFYDRFLSKCRPDCQRIGLSFFLPERTIDGIEPYDQKLDQVITPDRVFTFPRE